MARCVLAGIIVTYALAVFQTTLGGRIALGGVAPDLLFVWTVTVGLLGGRTLGALTGFGSGLLEGCLTQAWMGSFAFSKMVSGFAAGLLATKMSRDNWAVPSVCAMLLTVVNETAFLLTSQAGGWHQAGRIIGLRAIYHGALAPLAFALTIRARRALAHAREEMA